jgi:hypothetical protein
MLSMVGPIEVYGGGLIAVDKQANIYLAGNAQASVNSAQPQGFTIPTLPAGAFQSTHAATFCYRFGSGPGGIGGELACGYQYVPKLNPTGRLLWATYVTGTYGATEDDTDFGQDWHHGILGWPEERGNVLLVQILPDGEGASSRHDRQQEFRRVLIGRHFATRQELFPRRPCGP